MNWIKITEQTSLADMPEGVDLLLTDSGIYWLAEIRDGNLLVEPDDAFTIHHFTHYGIIENPLAEPDKVEAIQDKSDTATAPKNKPAYRYIPPALSYPGEELEDCNWHPI